MYRWRFWSSGLRKAVALLQATWTAYSQPVPAGCGQLLTQVLLCGSLALAAASLTYCWLASSLLYPLGPSAAVATACGLLAFLGLGLVPPARCLFALSVPTLGTEQGRRLLLSWSTATLTVAVVPNVLANLRAAGSPARSGALRGLLRTVPGLDRKARRAGGEEKGLERAAPAAGAGAARCARAPGPRRALGGRRGRPERGGRPPRAGTSTGGAPERPGVPGRLGERTASERLGRGEERS